MLSRIRKSLVPIIALALCVQVPGFEFYAALADTIPTRSGNANNSVNIVTVPHSIETSGLLPGTGLNPESGGTKPTDLSFESALNPDSLKDGEIPKKIRSDLGHREILTLSPEGGEKKGEEGSGTASTVVDGSNSTPEKIASQLGKEGARSNRIRGVVLRALRFFSNKRTPPDLEGAVAPTAVETDALPSNHADQGLRPALLDDSQSGHPETGPPAPVSSAAPKDGKSSKGALFGLGLAGFSIIGYMLAMQAGLEAQGVAMPQMTENAFKDFTLLPLVTVFASIGSMIGQPMAKFFIDHLGMSKTFYAAHALRAISLGTMVLLFGTGMVSMSLMMGFYLFNGVVTGIASTAEGTLRKLILAEKGVSMESFRTWWQLLAETLAVPAPIFFGAMVYKLGALGAPIVTAVYPVTILLGLIMAYVLKIYPMKDVKKASDAAAKANGAAASAAPASVKKGVWAGVKAAAANIFASMEAGKDYVMSMPYLKYSLGAATVFDMFNVIIYRLLAPGYGKMTGGAAGLSAVQGNLVGMFSLGGLLLSVVFLTLESRAKAKAKKNPTPEAAAAAERSSMLRWMFAGIPALALLATMAFHMALPLPPLIIGGTNYMPASVFAAALIPFGFFQVAASIKLNSYFQEKLPQDADKVQKALAFSGSVMTALSIVTMLAMRPLFSAVGVFNPFPWMAAVLVPVAAGLFFLMSKLAKATTPEAIASADAAGEPSASENRGAYVGLILGIVIAAVVITTLPMIPGVGTLITGLGVMGKFLLNLALTVAFPLTGMLWARAKAKK